MIIDVHAHLDYLESKKLIEIQNDEKIKLVISNSVNLESCKKNLDISEKFSKVKTAFGLYPEKDISLDKYEKFEEYFEKHKNKIIALGEIGLDFSHELPEKMIQIIFFKNQLDLARKNNLPVIIHTRKAEKEILEILENYKDLKIILHCFSGNFKLVKKALELGCYFSIPTNIVRSEHFQKMVKEIPFDRILTETDSPYLSPYKDKKNEPIFIKETIKKISEILEKSENEIENYIEKNYKKIFS